MTELNSQLAPAVVAACTANASEAGEALARALDHSGLTLGQPQTTTLDAAKPPESMIGAGLAMLWQSSGVGAVALLSAAGGLVPSWCTDPDPTGRSKLTTLAQELGLLLFPDDFAPDVFTATHVSDMAAALAAGQPAAEGGHVEVPVTVGDVQGVLHVVWPLAQPQAVLSPQPPPQGISPGRVPLKAALGVGNYEKPEEAVPSPTPSSGGRHAGSDALPNYMRSLLKISVPVVVTLAQQRQRLDRVLELAPGSIIQFDKSCEDLLDLEVGGQSIARGEAVKVGDKFGLRVTSIVLPRERFLPVRPGRG